MHRFLALKSDGQTTNWPGQTFSRYRFRVVEPGAVWGLHPNAGGCAHRRSKPTCLVGLFGESIHRLKNPLPSKKLDLQAPEYELLVQIEFLPLPAHSQSAYEALLLLAAPKQRGGGWRRGTGRGGRFHTRALRLLAIFRQRSYNKVTSNAV